MKLELKHLAPYLQFRLKMINVNQRVLSGIKTDCHILTLDGIRRNGISFEGFGGFYEVNDYYVFKPFLRPLSDLTKEIEVNGERFVPMVKISKLVFRDSKLVTYSIMDNLGYYGVYCDWGIRFETNVLYYFNTKSWYIKVNGNFVSMFDQFHLFEILFEWHFDVFGLIDAGLAIDINTLNK